jgi:hypothetical protein
MLILVAVGELMSTVYIKIKCSDKWEMKKKKKKKKKRKENVLEDFEDTQDLKSQLFRRRSFPL